MLVASIFAGGFWALTGPARTFLAGGGVSPLLTGVVLAESWGRNTALDHDGDLICCRSRFWSAGGDVDNRPTTKGPWNIAPDVVPLRFRWRNTPCHFGV